MFYPIVVSSGQSSSAEVAADSARLRAISVETKLEAVQCDIERLLMITEALWTCLKKHHGYTDADLVKLVTEIDLRDGHLDGRVAPAPLQSCPHCGRPVAKKRPLCIYCGSAVPSDPFGR